MAKLRHFIKYYIANPIEFYSKLKGIIIQYYYKFYMIIKNHKLISKDKGVYLYLNKKYKTFLDSLPLYNQGNGKEDIVRWCWLQGESKAPKLNKSCLNSIKKYIKNKKLVILTNENILDYVKFPNYILEKYKSGIISKTHFSDLLRSELLIKYGGIWIDSTVLLTDYDKKIFDNNFFVFQNNDETMVLSSRFIISNRNNPILITTRDLLYEYWKKNDYLLHYFLFHIFFTMAVKRYPEIWDNMPKYSNVPPHTMQHEFLKEYNEKRFKELKKISSVHKLRNVKNANENSLFRYIENHGVF